MAKTFKDLVNATKPIKIYGIAKNGSSILTRNVIIRKHDSYWGRNSFYLYSYTSKGRLSGTERLDNNINLNTKTLETWNYTYYLDPKTPYSIAIDRIRKKQRDLNAKKLKLQIELAKYGETDK